MACQCERGGSGKKVCQCVGLGTFRVVSVEGLAMPADSITTFHQSNPCSSYIHAVSDTQRTSPSELAPNKACFSSVPSGHSQVSGRISVLFSTWRIRKAVVVTPLVLGP